MGYLWHRLPLVVADLDWPPTDLTKANGTYLIRVRHVFGSFGARLAVFPDHFSRIADMSMFSRRAAVLSFSNFRCSVLPDTPSATDASNRSEGGRPTPNFATLIMWVSRGLHFAI